MRSVKTTRSAIATIAFVALFAAAKLLASDSTSASPVGISASTDEVVDNLIRMNQQRTRDLLYTESRRVYHLTYSGFPGGREAEMIVDAIYNSPSSKEFKIVSQTGSKIIIDRVFKKLLEGEIEAARPEIRLRTELNRDNYAFQLVNYEPAPGGGKYVLQVIPKSPSKYAYRGHIWVDKSDFAVTNIAAEPARSPSFWTKKSEIRYEYKKVQGFWLPSRSESVSEIRLGGHATLTIEYTNYHVNKE